MVWIEGTLRGGRGQEPERPADERHHSPTKGPAETVGGAVGGVVDVIGRRVHKLLLGHL